MKSELEIQVNYIFAVYIWKSASPVLLLVGTISNTLSITVLTRRRMVKSNTMFYLAVLSGANIIILYVGLLRYWLRYAFHVDIRTLSDVICKGDAFLVYYTSDFINWTLVAVAVDRCIHVCLPLKAKIICTRRRAVICLITMSIVLFLFNMHLFWGVHIAEELGQLNCSGANYFTNFVWSFLDLCVRCLIPFIVMIVTNVLITIYLLKSSAQVAALRQTPVNGRNSKRRYDVRIAEINRTLQLISLMFLLLATPSAIYEIYLPYFPADAKVEDVALMELLRAIANILLYSNNVLHFFVYILSNSTFRHELQKLCRNRRQDDQRTGSVSSIIASTHL